MTVRDLIRQALRWPAEHPRSYNAGRVLLSILLSVGLGWLAVTGVDWSQVMSIFRSFPIVAVLIALALFLLSNVVRAYRWQLLFVEERVSVLRLFLVQNAGIGLNNLMPIRVFSEATQFALLTLRSRVTPGTALATLGVERVLDMVASTLLLALGLILLPQMGGLVGFGPQMALGVLLSLVFVGLMRFLAWGSQRWGPLQRVHLLHALGLALAKLEQRWVRLGASFLGTLLYWTMLGLCAWVVGRGIGLTVPLSAVVVTVVVVTFFATSLPSLPGAAGTFEFAAIYMLQFFGVRKEQALPFALLVHAIFYVPPILFAVALLPREGFSLFRPWGLRQSHEPAAKDAGP